MIGTPLAVGRPTFPVRALVQGGGSAMRMSAKRFVGELKKNGGLRKEVDRSIYVSMVTAMQIVACNKSHSLAPRLARWLLMTRDRVGSDEFALTQEFLANMLGVRRAGVTEAAGALQDRGLIRYRRGRIRILRKEELRAASCQCYEVIRKLESGRG